MRNLRSCSVMVRNLRSERAQAELTNRWNLQVAGALEYAARVAHRWEATREGLLEWLLVHVPPEQLPARWGGLSSGWSGLCASRAC